MIAKSARFGRRGALLVPPVSRPNPAPPSTAEKPQAAPGFFARLPWLTFVLCGTLIFKFNTEMRAAVDYSAPGALGHFSLLALGASSRAQIMGQGEWWRLFTAPLLHGSSPHLVGNLVVLLVAGSMLEPLVGIGWFGAIYFIGGFSGTLTSMLLNPADAQSVGASGAIMSCIACLFGVSYHYGVGRPRSMRRISGALLFPALIPTVSHGAVVDVNAHFGGTLAGVALAFLLLILWSDEEPQVPGRSAAALVAGGFIALTVAAFMTSWSSYDAYATEAASFIPQVQLQHAAALSDDESSDLVGKYPQDPRGHLLQAFHLLRHGDFDGSEGQLEEAKRLADLHKGLLSLTALREMRTALATTVAKVRSLDAGRRVAEPLCTDPELEDKLQKSLTAASLCGPA
jgi:rhomboid protease GluP